MNALLTVDEQLAQCRRWRDLLVAAGYEVWFLYTGERDQPAGFDQRWDVYTQSGELIASIDIDGCGASWHGPDELWTTVIGASEGVTA